LIER
jgi:hypothetical protein